MIFYILLSFENINISLDIQHRIFFIIIISTYEGGQNYIEINLQLDIIR